MSSSTLVPVEVTTLGEIITNQGAVEQPKNPIKEAKLYRYNAENQTWSERTDPSTKSPTNSFAIITWNVDFSRNHAFARLETSLDHLQSLIEPLLNADHPIATVILLQELHRSCFPILLKNPFVRAHYDLTDISPKSWSIHYGVVTLAPRSLDVISAFRSVYRATRMGRQALFIDIAFPAQVEGDIQSDPRIVRVANTHLESLRGYADSARPKQLAVAASFLSKPGIYAGIIGGDMNPIGPQDDSVPAELGLLDGWVVCKQPKVEDGGDNSAVENPEDAKRREAEGYTWGYQPPSRFSPCRMDKVLFVGNLNVKDIERVGVGLEVHPDKVGGEKAWASDHYGLLATIDIL